MKNTLILPEVYLHSLNAFDVGNNPEHVNHGKTASELSNLAGNHLQNMSTSDYLTISGHALEILDEDSPDHIDSLKEEVQKNAISLVGVPYYNTSLALLSAENFKAQWQQNQEKLQKHFGTQASALYTANQSIPAHLSSVVGDLGLKIIGDNSFDIESLSLGNESNKEISSETGEHSSYVGVFNPSELASHVGNELKALEPFLTQDKELSKSWQLLANTKVMSSLEGEDPQHMYNNYFSMMNILNDIAHTIRNVELTKKGEFETTAEIVDQPSKRVFEVLENKALGAIIGGDN